MTGKTFRSARAAMLCGAVACGYATPALAQPLPSEPSVTEAAEIVDRKSVV